MDRGLLDKIAREFDLGALLDATPLPGGHPDVTRIRTERDSYVVKRPWDLLDVKLYATVEQRLNEHGIRQARQLRTVDGELVASTGHAVQEFLPGAIADVPNSVQTTNTIIHLAEFDRALATVDVPAELDQRDTVWTRVVDPGFLLDQLPELITQHGPNWLDPKPVKELLAALEAGSASLAAQPRQLIHGDLGPDNALYDGDQVVALIDFTPFHDSPLLGLASTIYFFQLYGQPADRAAIDASIDAYGAEPAVAWTALVRESLRRLATPLAVADERGTPPAQDRTRLRYQAAVRLARLL